MRTVSSAANIGAIAVIKIRHAGHELSQSGLYSGLEGLAMSKVTYSRIVQLVVEYALYHFCISLSLYYILRIAIARSTRGGVVL